MIMKSNAGLYLFISCRWVLLLTGLLIYSINGGTSSIGLFMAMVGIQAFCSLIFLNQSLIRYVKFAISIDMLFQIYLLWSGGGLSGPFVVYSLTSLIMLKKYVSWKAYYVITTSYLLSLPVLFYFIEGTILEVYIANNSAYVIYLILFYGAVETVRYSSNMMNKHFRKLAMIYSSNEPNTQSSLKHIIRSIEQLLKRTLDGREVWICLSEDGPHEQYQSWVQTYLGDYLKHSPPSANKAYIYTPSPTGERMPLYVQALQDCNKSKYGWLLIKANKNELSTLHRIYIQLIIKKLNTQYSIHKQVTALQNHAVSIERNLIAQNIHDGIAQELFFLSVQLFQLKKKFKEDPVNEALPLITEMENRIKENHRDIRKLIIELKGEERKNKHQDAIETMLRRITDPTGVMLVYDHIGWVPQEKVEIEETIYHFIEEAANNVIKHAKASKLSVKLEVTSVQWTIVIIDDGIGMKEDIVVQSGKYGISGMMNRIKGLSGTFHIHSVESKGTTITATIPRERSLSYV